MTQKTFNECLNKIRCGNTQGLEDIFNEYYKKIYYTALWKVHNETDAEDIASNFITYLFENIRGIPYIENPSAWINFIVMKRSIDHIRRKSKTVAVEQIDEDAAVKDITEENHLLVEVMNQLDEYQQQLSILHFLYGFKYGELSKMVQRPVGTIKSDISIIRKKIMQFKKF